MSLSLQKDITAKLLKTYLPPFKGTWKTLPAYLLPDDVLQDSLNVTLQAGRLRSRAGLLSYDSGNLGNRVLGSFLTVDTTKAKYPICSTKNTVYRYIANWENITNGLVLNASDSSQVRMTSLQIGTFVDILYANGIDTVKVIPQSTYLLNNITPYAGSIPVCTDICTSFSRIVGITPPYTIQWCDALNNTYVSYTNWPSINQAILADTEDALVAVRSLGTLGLAVYKEGNIFVGFPQSGPNSQAFRFEHRGEYEGPAGVNAIVNVNGTHVYMTPSGRVGLFDGTNQSFICDGLWPFLQDDIDKTYASRIFGVYNYQTSEIYFWYPRVGDAGSLKGMIIIDMPYPLAGITDFAYFLGRSSFDCSNGLSIRLFNATVSPLVFGSNNETFRLDKDTYRDKTSIFSCSLTTPLYRPTEQEGHYRPIFTLYATRDSSRGLAKVSAIVTDLLENNGVATVSETVDLTQIPNNEYISFSDGSNQNDVGSFIGGKVEWDSTAKLEYKGLDVFGRSAF